jgi:hypothetical protein
MRPTLAAALAAAALLASPPASAGDRSPPPAAAEQLARLKALAGTWTGKASHSRDQPGMDTTVTWRVTGGGSAVMETIDPGSDHEMVTLYHLDGDRLTLTHYCAAGNQPTMRSVKSGDPRALAFDFARGSNMKGADLHMHAVRITFVDEGNLITEWTSWKDRKPAGTVRFALARQK